MAAGPLPPQPPLDANDDPAGSQVWQYFLAHPKLLPVLKGHSARVLAMAGKIMTIDIAELMSVVRADPTSVAELLRTANGPLLFRGSTVTVLDEAIIRLGRREVYNVLTTVAARSLFKPHTQSLLQLMPKPFWQVQHDAVVTALCSAWLNHNLRLGDYEEAFLLGMFGRIGRLGALFALGHLALADALLLPQDPTAFVLGRPQMVVRMGQDMLRGWSLGETLVQQCTALGQSGPWHVRAARPLQGVRLIEALVAKSQGDMTEVTEQALQASREGLGLAETQLPAIEREVQRTCATVGALLGEAKA